MVRNLVLAFSLVVVIGLLVWVAVNNSGSRVSQETTVSGYEVRAHFDNVGNLKLHAPVTAAGVRVGRVVDISYNFENYEAVVKMVIEDRYDRFPLDTAASILTTGLVGEQYVELQPGAEITFLKQGDQIDITSSALILEQIIGQFLYSMSDSGNEAKPVEGSF